MRLLIRTDASSVMGTGHVMRCLTLAECLRARGHEVGFICRSQSGDRIETIRSRDFIVHVLPHGPLQSPLPPWLPAHSHWLGASWEEDADSVRKIAERKAGGVDGLIVDHYGLDASWERRLRPSTGWIAVLDDLADRPHECDILLDQNLHTGPEARYRGLVSNECRLLLGPAYALLRDEFASERARLDRNRKWTGRILVYFGGNDSADNTAKAVEAIGKVGCGEMPADVVIHGDHAGRAVIERLCAAYGSMRLHTHVERMSELMAMADLAIGAGGTTSWERCCLGLPCLAICVADNQAELLDSLHAKGALIRMGRSSDVTAHSLAAELRNLAGTPEKLKGMTSISSSLVDGAGALRVAAALEEMAPREAIGRSKGSVDAIGQILRETRPGDAALYFTWTNEPETRRNSFNPEPIAWPGHREWFRSRLADPAVRMYVLEIGGQPVGEIRFSLAGSRGEINFSVAAPFRGKGFGTALLRMGAAALQAEGGDALALIGYVKSANASSAKAFLKAGFERLADETIKGGESLVFRKIIREPSASGAMHE